MSFTIQATQPDPPLDVDVVDRSTGKPARLTVLGGVVAVGPAGGGVMVRVSGGETVGEHVGLYVPGSEPIPPDEEVTTWAEGTLSQVVVSGATSQYVNYGVGEVAVQLVADPNQGGARLPYLSFQCFGGFPLGVRYRVTILRPA
ncbi:MAG: hypothetical protein ACRDY6_05800 [Acidimicrobiia bacterium]